MDLRFGLMLVFTFAVLAVPTLIRAQVYEDCGSCGSTRPCHCVTSSDVPLSKTCTCASFEDLPDQNVDVNVQRF